MTDNSQEQKHHQLDNTLSECGIPGCEETEQYMVRDRTGNIMPVCAEHWDDTSYAEVEYDGLECNNDDCPEDWWRFGDWHDE